MTMIDKQRGYRASNKLRELVSDNAMLLPAISRFGISFGFGDGSVELVCRENNVHAGTFLCVCNLLSGYPFSDSDISLSSLMRYLKNAHSYFLDIELIKIRRNLIEAINYSDSNEVTTLLMKFYDDYVVEVKKHMEFENEVIFKYVERLLEGELDSDYNISRYSDSHVDTAEKLKELKDLFIYHYKQKDNARLSGVLFDIITCERDMLSHFDVESRLLIPAVRRLEKQLRDNGRDLKKEKTTDVPAADPQLALLSEREKDIIRCVAKGLVNKEIADRLCISVHTVATHRRNIAAKLEIHTPAGLIVFAILHRLVDLTEVTPA